MKEAMTEYWKEGFQIHIHTNGDLAMEVVLNIVEELNMKWPRGTTHRTTIEHAGFFTRDQAKLLAKLNCLVSAQPYYNYCLADKYSEVLCSHNLLSYTYESFINILQQSCYM